MEAGVTTTITLATTTPPSSVVKEGEVVHVTACDEEGSVVHISDAAAGNVGLASPDVITKDADVQGDVERVVAGRLEEECETGEVGAKSKEATPDSDSVFDTAPSTPSSSETQRPLRLDKSSVRKSDLNKASSEGGKGSSLHYFLFLCLYFFVPPPLPPPLSPLSLSSSSSLWSCRPK